MIKKAFDYELYVKSQSEKIKKRIAMFDNKLYLEFGGKLFDDLHASRILPGFKPDTKIKMLCELKENVEIVIVINAVDIEKNKIRSDLKITYDLDVLRLIDAFRSFNFYVGSVVITHYANQNATDSFKKKLEGLGINVVLHYLIDGYPSNVPFILSEEGFGRNEYIETTRELIVVTAPGPGSGKMATCLSQLYHDYKRNIKSGYAKFETFPVYNLSLNHPVNLAYEAATADLNDINMIDPFHLEAYNETVVNYNRDVEVYPVLNSLFEKIAGKSPYKSPTDMGVNMAGHCIIDDNAARTASKQEIIRRYYDALRDYRKELVSKESLTKIELLMNQANISIDDRRCVKVALDKSKESGNPAVAIELTDGTIVSGKTSELMGPSSAAILNALKYLGGINEDIPLISPAVIDPIQQLKINHLGNENPRLHTDEVLIALSIAATNNPISHAAIKQLEKLEGAQVHSTVILAEVDEETLRSLKMNITSEPTYHSNKLYQKN